MELSLYIIFWYGILHAFYPDHLSVIADFSIGESKKKTFLITLFFAIGHGVSLFIFAKVLEYFTFLEGFLKYGDIISASVILFMGFYLLFMVATNRVRMYKHIHKNKEHIHIWFGKSHQHNPLDKASSLTLGVLMGASGARGMLVMLGAVQNQIIDLSVIGVFVLGVMVVFILFGAFMFYVNQKFLNTIKNIRMTLSIIGTTSLLVGANILLN